MTSWLFCVIALLFSGCLVQGQTCFTVNLDWNDVVIVSKTTTTLQVVANPLLNPETCPIALKCFESLANLEADLVRYVPWFPYPQVGVAELDPPANGKTSWNFTYINPQLELFMNSTEGKGHTTIPNFSTQPTWMYDTNDWSYPADPNAVDWNYPRGNAISTTTSNLADYYARLISWLTLGHLIDEYGKVHRNGHYYNITHWELFNEPEGCHGLDYKGYVLQYDAIVKKVRQVADPQKKIQFVGLALSGRDIDWITYFLTPSNHDPSVLPLPYFSYHFYASCSNRTDPSTYTSFFYQAEAFLVVAEQIMSIKNQLSPSTKIDVDEMGVILPDDNVQSPPPIPSVYWNAAGGMYAYLFGSMALLGYDVLGESQLVGSPAIPEWDIPESQFPSVSLLNWTTGEGNARYWVLKLLLENFRAGDSLIQTTVNEAAEPVICGFVNGMNGYDPISLTCADPTAVISSIDFAAFGTPYGTCGAYHHNYSCDALNTTSIVKSMCLGKPKCSVESYPLFGDPCYGVYKDFIIQARCSGNKGGWAVPPATGGLPPFAQGFIMKKDGAKKVLLVNRNNDKTCITITGANGQTIEVIDVLTGDNRARKEKVTSNSFTLNAFAVAVLHL